MFYTNQVTSYFNFPVPLKCHGLRYFLTAYDSFLASLVCFQFSIIGGLGTGNRGDSVLINSLFGIGSVNRSKAGRWGQCTDGVAPDGVSVEPVDMLAI